MNVIKKPFFILCVILVVASFLRLWQLGNVPPSPDWDEAALGYNAYSLLETGRDEYGNLLPVVLRSFDDYKPAFYAYILIPFIKLFDLTLFTVRLPAALFGIAAVLITYFFVQELLKDKRLSLLAAFLLAISPWHLQFSRTAFEAGCGMALNVLMALLFIKGPKKHLYFIAAGVVGGLNIYMYQSEKVFTPLLFLLLLFIYHKEIIKVPLRIALATILIGGCILMPMGSYILTHSDSLSRATKTVSFADEKMFLRDNSTRQLQDRERKDILGQVLDNRRLVYLNAVWTGYISHFDINWLFVTGDANRHHAPSMGLLYLIELPFFCIGIYCLAFSQKISRKAKLLIFGWILLTPIPASIGNDFPHSVRTINILPMLQIIVALGILQTEESVRKKINRSYLQWGIMGIIVVLFMFNIIYYLNQYFVQLNYFYSKDWQYGYKAMVEKLKDVEKNYTRIVVSDKAPMDQSYIFVLFYSKFPPDQFQKAMSYGQKNNLTYRRFGKFDIRPIQWERDKYSSGNLYIGTPVEFPADTPAFYTIYYLDKEPAMKFVDPQDATIKEL